MPRHVTELALAEGEITQIDYDDAHGHRITRIRVEALTGEQYEVRFTYPEPDWDLGISPEASPVVVLPPRRGPEVRVVRLV